MGLSPLINVTIQNALGSSDTYLKFIYFSGAGPPLILFLTLCEHLQ
jgi:hypothetical protein